MNSWAERGLMYWVTVVWWTTGNVSSGSGHETFLAVMKSEISQDGVRHLTHQIATPTH